MNKDTGVVFHGSFNVLVPTPGEELHPDDEVAANADGTVRRAEAGDHVLGRVAGDEEVTASGIDPSDKMVDTVYVKLYGMK